MPVEVIVAVLKSRGEFRDAPIEFKRTSSTSIMIAVATNVFVTEAIR
jgi:hypothetical protein